MILPLWRRSTGQAIEKPEEGCLPLMALSLQKFPSMRDSSELIQVFSQADRVRDSFPRSVNERIDSETQGRIDLVLDQGPEAIQRRLWELGQEWDIDRALMATFGVVGGATFSVGVLKNKRLLGFLGIQLAFLMNHAVKGWCPPASVLRRMGFRTQKEIQAERQVLINALLEARVQGSEEPQEAA